ncbi:MAG: helix-turn-helix domain-containing protein [Pseudomonadota bacterium]
MTPKASRCAEAYWTFTAADGGRSLILPDGRCDIIYRSGPGGVGPLTPVITGPATQPYWVDYQPGDTWMGVRLRPENAALLWGGEIGAAQNTVLRGKAALARLPRVDAPGDVRPYLLSLVARLSQAQEPTCLPQLMDALHASGGRIRMEHLAQFAGWSTRHLGRIFRAQIGVSAKTYAQLVQFHRTLRLIRDQRLPLAAAAYEGGYADQSHLTRAFQRFGGFAPSEIPAELSVPTLFPM